MLKNFKDLSTDFQTSIRQPEEETYCNLRKPQNLKIQNNQFQVKKLRSNQKLVSQVQRLKRDIINQKQAHQKSKFSIQTQLKKVQLQLNINKQEQKQNENLLNKKLNKYKNKIIQLQEKIQKQNQKNQINQQNFEIDIKKLKTKIRCIQQELQEKIRQIAQNKRQIKQLKYLNETLQINQSEIQRIKLQNRQLTKKLIKHNSFIQFDYKMKSIDAERLFKQEQIKQYKRQFDKLINQNQSLLHKIKSIQKQLNNYINENNRLNNFIYQLQSQLRSYKRKFQTKCYQQQDQCNIYKQIKQIKKNQYKNVQSYRKIKELQKINHIYQKAFDQKNNQLAYLQQKIQQLKQQLHTQKESAAYLLIEKNQIIKQKNLLLELLIKLQQHQKNLEAQNIQQNNQEHSNSQCSLFIKDAQSNIVLSETRVKHKQLLFSDSIEQQKGNQTLRKNQDYNKKYNIWMQQKQDFLIEIQKYQQISLQKDKIIEKYQQQKKYLLLQIKKCKKISKTIKQQAKANIAKIQIEKIQQIKKLNYQLISFQQKIKNGNTFYSNFSKSTQESPKITKKLPTTILQQPQRQISSSSRQKNYKIEVLSPKEIKNKYMQQSSVSVSLEQIYGPKPILRNSQNPNFLKTHLQQSKVAVTLDSPKARQSIVCSEPNKLSKKLNQKKIIKVNHQSRFQQSQNQNQLIVQRSNTGKSDPLPANKNKVSIVKDAKSYLKTQRNYYQDYPDIKIIDNKGFKMTESNIFDMQQ